MARKILLLGDSGTGKTHSLQFLDPKTTVIICPENKDLPWRGSEVQYVKAWRKSRDGKRELPSLKGNFIPVKRVLNYANTWEERWDNPGVLEYIERINIDEKLKHITTVVVDTFTYAMTDRVVADTFLDDWNKYKLYAKEFYDFAQRLPELREDLTVIVSAHTETDRDEKGKKTVRFKVPAGKMTSQVIVPEGLFTIVLFSDRYRAEGEKTQYFFWTVNDGTNTCKTPEGMYPKDQIPCNMEYVIRCMKAYYKGEEPPPMPDSKGHYEEVKN